MLIKYTVLSFKSFPDGDWSPNPPPSALEQYFEGKKIKVGDEADLTYWKIKITDISQKLSTERHFSRSFWS